MDLFFVDPSETPLPPEEVRIRRVEVQVWPDGRKLKVALELDPFLKKPSLELTVFAPSGQQAASAEVIQTMIRLVELNLHLRGQIEPGEHTLNAVLFYAELPEQGEVDPGPIPRQIVDTAQAKFMVG